MSQSQRQEQQDERKVRDTVMQLSEITDLIGLRQHIIEGTNKGRKLKADPWHNTRDYLEHYAEPANTDAAIALFEGAGCKNESSRLSYWCYV